MTILRRATKDDMEELIRVGQNFAKYVPHGGGIVPSDEDLERSIDDILMLGAIFVAVNEDKIVGLLAAVLTPVWYNPSKVFATELGWWVEPEYRKGTAALRMVRMYEQWAKENGAEYAAMCNMLKANEKHIGVVYEKIGYIKVEQTFIKPL